MSVEVKSLQRKVDALNRLVQVSLVMNSTLTLDPLLQYIMHSATDITGAETASILLMDDTTRELRFETSTDPESNLDLKGMAVPLEGSIAGTIIRENRAIIIDDASLEPDHFRGVDEAIDFETRSLLGVPMRIKDRLVGVLEVLNKREGQFDDSDVRHITILASQAAVAIENTQLVEALKQANDDLEQVNKLKSDFIAIASHELRTPLGVVLGYASFLKEEAEGPAGDHAQRVLDSAIHLRNIIEDMTNLRYVQLNESELDIEDVPLSDILETAFADSQKLAEAKEQAFVLEAGNGVLTVRADKHLTTMAVTNVLNNAIKFTPDHGAIIVEASEKDGEARIMVKDNGVGLDGDDVEKIFDQFYQVEDHLTRRHNGMGLGLSIARAIVEKHNGRIWAESPGSGQGTTFWIALPLA